MILSDSIIVMHCDAPTIPLGWHVSVIARKSDEMRDAAKAAASL